MPRLRPFLLALALAGLAAAVGGQSSTANASVPLNAPATGTPVAAPYSPDPGGLEPVQDAQEPRPLGASGAAPVVGNASPTTATPAPAAASSSAEREREREEREAERERERESAPSSKQETEEEREREEREREAEREGRDPSSQPAAPSAEEAEEEEEREREEREMEAKLASGQPITAEEWEAEAARERAERRERLSPEERAAEDAARTTEAARLARYYDLLGTAPDARATASALAAATAAANPTAAAAERRAESREKKKEGGPAHGSAQPPASRRRGAGGGPPGAPPPPAGPGGGAGAATPPTTPSPPVAPINPAFPSPVGKAFPAAADGPAPRGISLSSDLPPLYEPSAGGRGLAPGSLDDRPTSFAAIARRVARDAFWLAADAATLDDMQAAANEKPEPRAGGALAKRLAARGGANSFGARPDDVPTLASPARVAAPGPKSSFGSALAASRSVNAGRPTPDSPITLSFAATAAVDQPVRRFRPPDQSLCVGNGVAIVGANAVLRSFDAETGAPRDGPVAIPDFFNLTGNFSDPGCIYDAGDSKRFFISMFRFNERSPGKFSHFVLAVSATSDPADGFYGPFIFPNDGLDAAGEPLPGLEACAPTVDVDSGTKYDGGCLGDYPSVGINEHSLWAGFNLFATEPSETYAGVLMLAISKPGLISGSTTRPAYAAFSNWDPELAYTVQPTVTQAGTRHDARAGGSIYLTSSGPVAQNEPNQPLLAVWAATHTDRLARPDFPAGGLPDISAAALLDVPAYRDPGVLDAERFCMPQPDPGVPLDAGDARTLQSVWSGGIIWTAAQTVVRAGPAAAKTVGAVWWAVRPDWNGTDGAAGWAPVLNATGYVAVPGHHASRPAITASPSGRQAWIGGTLVGDDLPPSPFVAQVHLRHADGGAGGAGPATAASHTTTVHVPAVSPDILAPGIPDRSWDREDPDLGGTLRAGDYSAATLDEGGRAWLASAWAGSVPSPVCVEKFAPIRCPNWGTYVTRADTDAVAGGVDGLAAAAKAAPAAKVSFGGGREGGDGGGRAPGSGPKRPGVPAAGAAASSSSKPASQPGKAPAAGGDASGGALAAAADASRKKGGSSGPKRRGDEEGGVEPPAAATPAAAPAPAAATPASTPPLA